MMSGPTIEGLERELQIAAVRAGLPDFSIERELHAGTRVYYRVKFGQSPTTPGWPAVHVLFEIPEPLTGRLHVEEVFRGGGVKGDGERLIQVLIQAARNAKFTLLTANPATPKGKALAEKLRITAEVPGEPFKGLAL